MRFLTVPSSPGQLGGVVRNQREMRDAIRRFAVGCGIGGDPKLQQKFVGNKISTTKYHPLTFLPQNLFEQFHRAANCYFLAVAVIQTIPIISPTNPITSILPLLFVLTLTALREGYEDFNRWLQDNEINHRHCRVLRDGKLETIRWSALKVGDIVYCEKDEAFPADLILVSSALPFGTCYIETSSLDGETNLKLRQAHVSSYNYDTIEKLSGIEWVIEAEAPNPHIYKFEGSLSLHPENDTPVPLNADQTLLRGATLRNTQFIYGAVVFTGVDTKLHRNSAPAPLKRTKMERFLDKAVLIMFGIQALFCLFSATGLFIYSSLFGVNSWYNKDEYPGLDDILPFILPWRVPDISTPPSEFLPLFTAVLGYFTFFILYNVMIPISLFVSLDTGKFIQVFFINSDIEMYHAATDTPARARTSDLNEELGQVEFIFSDKTGTLTQNKMEFRRFSIGGVVYGTDDMSSCEDLKKYEAFKAFADCTDRDAAATWNQNASSLNSVGASSFLEDLRSEKGEQLDEFLRIMAVCHSVIPEKVNDDNDDVGQLVYQAASPDEISLVDAARRLGYIFTERTPTGVQVEIGGKAEFYEVLHTIEFTSTRKRMSVVVKSPQGEIFLYSKGADSVICERLAEEQTYLDVTLQQLKQFAVDGLRTLCVAKKALTPEELKVWSAEYEQATVAMNDREAKVDACAEKIESGLFLVGATAIEDKLQDGVPETISSLARAGIRLWVLTGDKVETAINVGYACNLLLPAEQMEIKILEINSDEDAPIVMDEFAQFLEEKMGDDGKKIGLIIDGYSLLHIEAVKKRFLQLSTQCHSVICCRVSPKQKAMIVEMVKEFMKLITLAIGDGANDVTMIRAAHIGVGISGEEGLQAVRAADFSIAQFRYLCPLLLVHGRWNYTRNAKLVLYSFYENIALVFTMFLFNFFNGFSGQPLYESWWISMYNVMFAGLPPMIIAIFDRDLERSVLLKHPELYSHCRLNREFGMFRLLRWVGMGIFHGLLFFGIPLCVFWDSIVLQFGMNDDLYTFGMVVYHNVVITVILEVGVEYCAWDVYMWATMLLETFFIIGWSFGFSYLLFPFPHMFGNYWYLIQTPAFWGSIILCVTYCIGIDLVWKYLVRTWRPTPTQIFQEIQSEHVGFRRRIIDDYEIPAHLLGSGYVQMGAGAKIAPM